MRRRVAYAALLVLMLGQPMNAMACQQVSDDGLLGLLTLHGRFVPIPSHQGARENELVRCSVAKHYNIGGLALF